MSTTHLLTALKHMSQKSANAVQTGIEFTDFDKYMHVERTIEHILAEKMKQIDEEGGGIVLLVGSAGDGKSHLISLMKSIFKWGDDCYYNDATASNSPFRSSNETLKESLRAFNDDNIDETTQKLVLAINLGKLNSFIDDEEVKSEYGQLVHCAKQIFDDIEAATPPLENSRIKMVLFGNQQLFEIFPNSADEYPVQSTFLSSILDKIVNPVEDNPFYAAYKKDIRENSANRNNPIIINYELLSLKDIRHTIVMIIIEAIIRYKLIITPREYLDFIYSILVYPKMNGYTEKKDYLEALLPSLLFCDGENMIQHAISMLDPLKHSSTEHDTELSVLFTSYAIPKSYLPETFADVLPGPMISRINDFYDNNGRDIERTTKLVFRLKHLLKYHTESSAYKKFLSTLCGVFDHKTQAMKEIYHMATKAIPRHYGSYYTKDNMIPLNIQGGKYRMFANLGLEPQKINSYYSTERPNEFSVKFEMSWSLPNKKIIPLIMDYQLFSYVYELNSGKLSVTYENERNLQFGRFVRSLSTNCNCEKQIIVINSQGKEMILKEASFGNIEYI